MTDHVVFFEDLVARDHVRGKTYEVASEHGDGFIALDIVARNASDWYFARKWVGVRESRRPLYRLLDEVERHGYRFAVSTDPTTPPTTLKRASELLASLDGDEAEIFEQLFPGEATLLDQGYDWDGANVWKDDGALGRDTLGRITETVENVVYEWVRTPDEANWRRFPIERTGTA